jgi:tol-pal system protein YbgF
MKSFFSFFMLLSLALISGCASSGSVDAVRRDIDETKTRIFTIEKDMAGVRETSKEVMTNFEKNLASDIAALRKSQADIQAGFDTARSEVQGTNGKIDELSSTNKKLAEDLVRVREDADRRIVALEDRIVKLQAAMDELNKRVKEGTTSAAAPAEVKDDAAYQKGIDAFKAGDMVAARGFLSQFVEKQPNHELVANARYWIGETFYTEKNYEQAVLEFQEVIKQFPKKEKAPAAMLKQALSFKGLKDIKSSRYVLGKLVQDYPKSEEAKKAKVLLKELK